jgi:subtilisin family serine protease
MKSRAAVGIFLAAVASSVFLLSPPEGGRHLPAEPDSHSAPAGASPFSPAASIPAPSIRSTDPAERLLASAESIESRWRETSPGRLVHEQILRPGPNARLLGCREVWWTGPRSARLLQRRIFSAEHVLVETAPGTPEEVLRAHLLDLELGPPVRVTDNLFRAPLASPAIGAADEAVAALRSGGGPVVRAGTDAVGFGGGTPNDPLFGSQWNLRNDGTRVNAVAGADISAIGLWAVASRAEGVTVAILDSGVRTNHPDLQGRSWRGTNMVSNSADFGDDHGHGTGVAGVIAAERSNGLGIAGLLGDADYLVVKVLNAANEGLTSDVIRGLDYARGKGATVINMSLVGFPDDPFLRGAIDRCEEAGILLCISAGNNGTDNDQTPDFPSSFTNANIISVAGHDWTDTRWTGGTNGTNRPSNFGATRVDIFAPGASVPSADLTRSYGDYSFWTGTSFAAPHVTAIAAIIKSLNPSWTAPQIKGAILSSVVTNSAYAGRCTSGGRLDGLAAIGRAITAQPLNDTDADGAENILEYLAGTPADDAARWPAVSLVRDTGHLRLSMPRVVRPDARLSAEQTTALVPSAVWSTNGISDESDASFFRASVPIGASDRKFLRIKASPDPGH